MTQKLSRRKFLQLSAMSGLGAALAGCVAPAAPGATEAPTAAATAAGAGSASAPAELRFVWWGGQLRADITTQVIKMFEAKHPNVKFTYEPLGFEEYWTKMTTQAAGGGLPDIMQHGSPTLVEWAKNGFLLPLDEYVSSGVIDFTHVPEVLQSHGMVDGKIYGVSAGTNANGFVIDLDAFEKAGVDVPPDTWTWPEFEELVLTLHEKLDIWGFGMYLHHIDLWRVIYAGLGMELYAPDGKSLGYTDDQPLIDHMKMILRLQEAGAIPSLAEESEVHGLGPESQFIVSGQAAMDWLAGSNQLVALWTAAGEERRFKIMPVPRAVGGKQGLSIRPSQFEAITVHSQHPEIAAMFLDFFINDVEANKVLNGERGVPINTVVLEALKAEAQPPQAAIYDYLARLAEDSTPYSLVQDPLGVEDIRTNVYYPEFTDPVRYGLITPEEGARVLRERANEILAAAN
ncbi:MAG: ABC transporter substrate-binding protein [Litorilinea sp.]|nr:MAG: ABC transporter substrate-binding protein [Litorilinea sp.]